MQQNPYSTALNVLNSWDFQIAKGYNKLYLPQVLAVKKGTLIGLVQSTGLVALDQSGTALFSDLKLTSNQWSDLNQKSNWRFYLNTTNDFELNYYKTNFSLNHQYASTGLYNLTITFKNLILEQTVNVKQPCNHN